MSDTPVTVVFGGLSPEHDISILTGLQCERRLRKVGRDVKAVYWDRVGVWHLVPPDTEGRDYLEGPPAGSTQLEIVLGPTSGWAYSKGFRRRFLEPGVVLNCFHGGFGEDGGADSLFEAMGVPVTGGPSTAAAVGMDKLTFKALMDYADIPALPRILLTETTAPDFPPPYIVKPRYGGSTIGIETVDDMETAYALLETSPFMRDGAVLEPYRSDLFDLNIAFRTYPELQVSLVERPIRSEESGIWSYENKYTGGEGFRSAPRQLPAQVPDYITERIGELARRVATTTGLSGVVRVDFLSDGTELFVNELNSLPGSLALHLWPEEISAEQVLLDMIEEARTQRRRSVPTGFQDGAALRAAGGIASKLLGNEPQEPTATH